MPGCSSRIQSLDACLRSLRTAQRNHVRGFHCTSFNLSGLTESEHAALIDPTDLRGTLENVRAANRTSLVRTYDVHNPSNGFKRLSLTEILEAPEHKPSDDVLAMRQVESAIAKAKERRRRPDRAEQKRRAKEKRAHGIVQQLEPFWELKRTTVHSIRRVPWLLMLQPLERSFDIPARERLSYEIQAFSNYISPNEAENNAAKSVVTSLQSTLTQLDGDIEVELIGSRANGLASPLSDIDINLRLRSQDRFDIVEGRPQAVKLLNRVSRHLLRARQHMLFSSVQWLRHPRVPIIKMVHVPTSLCIDIQSTSGGFNSLAYVKHFQRELSTVKAVYSVLRFALQLRGLHIGSAGGLGSYPLMNMVVAAHKAAEARYGHVDYAEHLLEFLDMFGKFDAVTKGITVEPYAVCSLESFRDLGAPKDQRITKLFLRDPADPANNVCSSLSRIADLQATLRDLSDSTRKYMNEWDARIQDESRSKEDRHQSEIDDKALLGSLLRADWHQYSLRRRLLATRKPKQDQQSGSPSDWVTSTAVGRAAKRLADAAASEHVHSQSSRE